LLNEQFLFCSGKKCIGIGFNSSWFPYNFLDNLYLFVMECEFFVVFGGDGCRKYWFLYFGLFVLLLVDGDEFVFEMGEIEFFYCELLIRYECFLCLCDKIGMFFDNFNDTGFDNFLLFSGLCITIDLIIGG
jgi:hypothetical protein